MAPILKIDSFDLSSYIRLGPGEGFDPADSDFLEPQYGDSAIGAGDPLISIRERNREMAWPIHMTPRKSGGAFASTKDGLHQMVQALNRACRSARVIEWREDGATNSTFLDAAFCRFDVDYNYRRNAHLFCSGVLRVVTKPYGHTGSYRFVATGAASMVGSVPMTVGAFVPIASLTGDAKAPLHVTVGAELADIAGGDADRLLVGYAVCRPSQTVEMGASRLLISGASALPMSGVGSRAIRRVFTAGFVIPGNRHSIWMATLPASAYHGRNRVLAVMRPFPATTTPAGTPIAFHVTLNGDSITGASVPAIGPTAVVASGAVEGFYNVVDLGVFDVDPSAGATVVTLLAQAGVNASTTATAGVDTTAVLVLPEDATTLVVDRGPFVGAVLTSRATYSWHGGSRSAMAQGTIVSEGRRYSVAAGQRGDFVPVTPQASAAVYAFALNFDQPNRQAPMRTFEIGALERFAFHR